MTYKYIEMVEIASKPKTKVYEVRNIEQGTKLATIEWDCGWRRYIIVYESDCKFDLYCTLDIADFLKRLDKKY